MKLVRLTDEVLEQNSDKNIIFAGNSPAYFAEIYERYPDLKRPIAILDTNPKRWGICELMGWQIPVYEMAYLLSQNVSNICIILTDDYYREYFEKIDMMLGSDTALEEVYFFPNNETSYELEYREKYAEIPLQEILVFRSGPHITEYVKGMDFADNARALFEYALSIHLNEKYELVWIVKNPKEFETYKKYKNVSFLPFEASVSEDRKIRDEYYRVLCLAKFFFFTDSYGFVRNCRKDQVRVQLWHGYGYKKRLNSVPCGDRYEYMPVPGELYAALHAREFGLHRSQMLITGAPKTDWLFRQNRGFFEKLNIPNAKKYIFWMPTYRFSEEKRKKPVDGILQEETGLPLVGSREELIRINDFLRQHDMVLILKLHPFQDRSAVHVEGDSHLHILENSQLLQEDIQINQLLGMADALISDYSSAAVDFLVLNRPMAFLVEDEPLYSESRGFIFDSVSDYLPGAKIQNVDELMNFLEEISAGVDPSAELREHIRNQFYQYSDGSCSERVLQALGIF